MNDKQLKKYQSYLDKGFNEEQLQEIKQGIEDGNDISAYARIKMPASEMAHVRKTQNFKKSLSNITKENNAVEINENLEEDIDVRTRNEKIADIGIFIGDSSIVIAIILFLLIMLRIV